MKKVDKDNIKWLTAERFPAESVEDYQKAVLQKDKESLKYFREWVQEIKEGREREEE